VERAAHGAVSITRGLNPDSAMRGARVAEAPAQAARLHALCPMAHQVACAAAFGLAHGLYARASLDREAAAMAAMRFGLHWALAAGLRPDATVAAARRAAQTGDDVQLAKALRTLCDGPIVKAVGAAAHKVLAAIPDPDRLAKPLAARFDTMIQDANMRACALERGERLAQIVAAKGAARVSTLRGELHVEVDVLDGVIARYWSSAPTDRLMAPAGAVARMLAGVKDAKAARFGLLALDPCAEIQLAVYPERIDA
jgi:hypothetical protein